MCPSLEWTSGRACETQSIRRIACEASPCWSTDRQGLRGDAVLLVQDGLSALMCSSIWND